MDRFTLKSECGTIVYLKCEKHESNEEVHGYRLTIHDKNTLDEYTCVVTAKSKVMPRLNAAVNIVDGYTYRLQLIDDMEIKLIICNKYDDDVIITMNQELMSPNAKLNKRLMIAERQITHLEQAKKVSYYRFEMPRRCGGAPLSNIYEMIDTYLRKTDQEYVSMVSDTDNIKNIIKNKDGQYMLENKRVKYMGDHEGVKPLSPQWNVSLFIRWKKISIVRECHTKALAKNVYEKLDLTCSHDKNSPICNQCVVTYNKSRTCICVCNGEFVKDEPKCCVWPETEVEFDLSQQGSYIRIDGSAHPALSLNSNDLTCINGGFGTAYDKPNHGDTVTRNYIAYKLYHINYYEMALNALSHAGIHADTYTDPYKSVISIVKDSSIKYIYRHRIYYIVNGYSYDYYTLRLEDIELENIWYVADPDEHSSVSSMIGCTKFDVQLYIYRYVDNETPPDYI